MERGPGIELASTCASSCSCRSRSRSRSGHRGCNGPTYNRRAESHGGQRRRGAGRRRCLRGSARSVPGQLASPGLGVLLRLATRCSGGCSCSSFSSLSSRHGEGCRNGSGNCVVGVAGGERGSLQSRGQNGGRGRISNTWRAAASASASTAAATAVAFFLSAFGLAGVAYPIAGVGLNGGEGWGRRLGCRFLGGC